MKSDLEPNGLSQPNREIRKHDLSYLFACLGILIALSAFFYRAVFLGKPIAKLGLLSQIDAILNPSLKDAIISIGKDPSGYLIFFPNGHFAETMWSRLIFPLWNPLVACGYPLMGDPQSFIHSPAHLLALFSSPEMYNTGLLLEIAAGGLGMIVLGRVLSLSAMASAFAALAFVLCPRILEQVDIGNNECLFPWILSCFLWLASTPSVGRALLTGLACGVLVLMAHPETSFFAILFSGLCSFFVVLSRGVVLASENSKLGLLTPNSREKFLANLMLALKLFSLAALVSVCIAAPVVFPFLEFLKNAFLYKETIAVPVIQWWQFRDGFLSSQGPEPYFIGSVALLFLPLALCQTSRVPFCLAFCALICAFICLPQGLFLEFLSRKPYSFVATLYGIPMLALLLATLSGFGFDRLFRTATKTHLALLFVGVLAAACFPYWYLSQSTGTSDFANLWRVGRNVLTYTSVLAIAGFVVASLGLLFGQKNNKIAVTFAAGAMLLALNFASLSFASRGILPNCPQYSMVPPPVVEFVRRGERSLATGNNFLLTNASMNYDYADLRCFSPLLPKRYVDFITACGAECNNLYFYGFPELCSPLLDLASVKYVLTRSAVAAEDDKSPSMNSGFASGSASGSGLGSGMEVLGASKLRRLLPGLSIQQSHLVFDQENSQINCVLSWKIHELCNYRYAVQYCILDADGKTVWSGREILLGVATLPNHMKTSRDFFPVPTRSKFPVSACFRLKDTWVSDFIRNEAGSFKLAPLRLADANPAVLSSPKTAPLSSSDPTIFELAPVPANLAPDPNSFHLGHNKFNFQPPDDLGQSSSRHFRLVEEFPADGFRVYRNTRALPSAYLIDKVTHIANADTARAKELLQSKSLNPLETVIVEDGGSSAVELEPVSKATVTYVPISFVQGTNLGMKVTTSKPQYLVLTDAFYPGWNCKIDGKDTDIFPCNLMFRAVRIEKGSHDVQFSFTPLTYFVSLAVSICGAISVLLFAFFRRNENAS